MRVTSVSTGAANPKWRPDGKAILFQSRVYPGAEDEEASRQQQFQVFPLQISHQPVVFADDRIRQRPLGFLQLQHLLFHRVSRDQPVGEDRPRLSDAVRAVDRLRLHRRIPPRIQQKHVLRRRQIQAQPARLQADQKQLAIGTVLEVLDASLAVPRLPVQVLILQPTSIEMSLQDG
jgi:hypothetical protein